MAYYSIGLMIMFMIGTYVGYKQGKKEGVLEGRLNRTDTMFSKMEDMNFSRQQAYTEGFEIAKKLYYDDVKAEREAEQKRWAEENESKHELPIDLMMAYGVSDFEYLPKEVRAQYPEYDKKETIGELFPQIEE